MRGGFCVRRGGGGIPFLRGRVAGGGWRGRGVRRVRHARSGAGILLSLLVGHIGGRGRLRGCLGRGLLRPVFRGEGVSLGVLRGVIGVKGTSGGMRVGFGGEECTYGGE